jgi:hypothetical protein
MFAQTLPVDPNELAQSIGALNATSQMVYIIVLLVIVQLVFMLGFVLWIRGTSKTTSQENDLQGKHLDTMITMVREFSKTNATFAATVHYWGAERKETRAMMQSISRSQAQIQADVSTIKQHITKGKSNE